MKQTLAILLMAAAAQALVMPNSTSSNPPGPTTRTLSCGGGLDICGDLCFCSGSTVNCHADPTSQCHQMCSCA
ncbi:hypothetical protein F4780DRAFT_780046 [Xylariomycetidae sp. FL0641]|nr:hypothetical protein F4780DRAFT_780046 [Xylariomycetidae sp. FL0641]